MLLLVVSRLLGAALQVAVAALFGASPDLDAYLVASSIPQLMTGLYASGATIMLVPLLVRGDRADATSEQRSAVDKAMTSLVVLALSTTAVATMLAGPITSVLGYGFGAETLDLTETLFRWLMLFLALSALGSIVMGVLNGRGSFVLPGVASVGQSLIWLVLLLALSRSWGINALVAGAIGGALAFIVIQAPSRSLRSPRGFRPSFNRQPDALREFVGPLAVFGAVFAFGQISVVGDRFFASMLAPGAVSILDYAAKTHAVLLNVLGYSLVTPAYTRMSTDVAEGDTAGFARTVTFTSRMMLVAAVPTVLVTTLLREPIIRVLLERGAFTTADTEHVSTALALMAPAQLAGVFTLLLVYALFALRDTKALLGLAALSMIASLLFDLALFRPYGTAGIAIASSLAVVPSLGMMMLYVGRRLPGVDWRGLGSLALRVTAASALAALVSVALYSIVAGAADAPILLQLVALALSLVASLAVYGASLCVLRVDEIERLRDLVRRRMEQRKAD